MGAGPRSRGCLRVRTWVTRTGPRASPAGGWIGRLRRNAPPSSGGPARGPLETFALDLQSLCREMQRHAGGAGFHGYRHHLLRIRRAVAACYPHVLQPCLGASVHGDLAYGRGSRPPNGASTTATAAKSIRALLRQLTQPGDGTGGPGPPAEQPLAAEVAHSFEWSHLEGLLRDRYGC